MKSIRKAVIFLLSVCLAFSFIGVGVAHAQEEAPITYTATMENDTQIRVAFSERVEISGSPWISLRYVDAENTLLWSGTVNESTPLQFGGSWAWADESHTAILWTMSKQNTCLANTLFDVYRYVNGLAAYRGCTIKFSIEESGNVTGGDGWIGNITSADGMRFLPANKNGGCDGSYGDVAFPINATSSLDLLHVVYDGGEALKLTFSDAVTVSGTPLMGIAYYDHLGNVATDGDGRVLKFKGTWEYADEGHTVLLWKPNEQVSSSLKDIVTFAGANAVYADQGYVLRFYISESSDRSGNDKCIDNITAQNGLVRLNATNYAKQDILYNDIENAEIIVEPTKAEPQIRTEYVTEYTENYAVYFGLAGGLIILGALLGVFLGLNRKKSGKNAQKLASFAAIILAGLFAMGGAWIDMPVSAEEDAEKLLIVEDVVLVSDTQLVVRFNQPVVFNYAGDNRGPWIALRIVSGTSNYLVNGSDVLQWQLNVRYVGEKYDTLLLTYNGLRDFVDFSGGFASFYQDGRHARLCIEEVPYNQSEPTGDGLIDNITTPDGKTRLLANKPGGWDGSYFDIRVDYSYPVDLSKTASLDSVEVQTGGSVLSLGPSTDSDQEPETVVKRIVQTEVRNTPWKIAAVLSGGALLGAVLALLLRKGIGRKEGENA